MTRLTPRAGPQGAPDGFPTRAGDLLALIPDAAIAVDADGIVRGANARALDLFEAPRDAVVDHPAAGFVALPDLEGRGRRAHPARRTPRHERARARRGEPAGGHAGDILLQQAVVAWQRQLRGTDLLARIGGDEFAVLVPNCSDSVLVAVAERLRRGLAYVPGCAVGITAWEPGDSADDLMARADKALYADTAATQG